jgi:hypothetical protein
MFGTGTRFAEYGITGGFLIVTQIVMLGWLVPDGPAYAAVVFGNLFTAISAAVPAPAQPALQSLVVALALLSVFITGLLLDLVGSYSLAGEARLFRYHLIKNRRWVSQLIETELSNYAGDYARFLRIERRFDVPSDRRKFIAGLALWRSDVRRTWRRSRLCSLRRMQKTFRRLEAGLVARIVASGTKTDLLVEQLSVCRMARAIVVALMLMAVEAWSFAFWLSFRSNGEEAGYILLWQMLPTVVTVVGVFISNAAYSRLCLLLFSLLYASLQTPRNRGAGGGLT